MMSAAESDLEDNVSLGDPVESGRARVGSRRVELHGTGLAHYV